MSRGNKIMIIVMTALLVAAVIGEVITYRYGNEQRNGIGKEEIASLELALLDEYGYDDETEMKELGFETTDQLVLKVFGSEEVEDGVIRVYGYEYDSQFVNFKGKAYDLRGGLGPVVVDVKKDGDNIKIVKLYGDKATTDEEYEMMPEDYRKRAQNFEGKASDTLSPDMNSRVEKALGVQVDEQYDLRIDGDKYQIYEYTDDVNVIDEGKLSDVDR